jgi:hypothetical protein
VSAVVSRSSSRRVLRSGLSVQDNLGYRFLADIESIVNAAPLGARDQPTIPGALQMSFPETAGVFSANDGTSSSPIKHLLSGRIVIEPINLLLHRREE